MLVMLADKHTRNACLLSNPSGHVARGVPNQDTLVRTPLWLTIMEAFPSRNESQDPKQEDGNNSRQLAQSPQVSICPLPPRPPPMVTSLIDWSKVIIRPMKDGNGKRTFKLGLIVTMSRNPTDFFALHIEQKPPNTLQQDSPIPCMPHKNTLGQPTPGPSGTPWSEDLFHSKKPTFPFLILTFTSSKLTFPPFVEPFQQNESPIPRPSQASEPHEDALAHEPKPEVAPAQSMEKPFACPTTPACIIIIDNTTVGSLLFPPRTQPPAPLNLTMMLSRNLWTCN
ncbi:hypothetical protein O181_025879 [Austropuccinia psidii MF-1]|uniref:Uncharacterized protein n=1 Tax=Austropuccinia psidii MF-1 TaxID=1389203 RepID=A0A9Q3CIX4_9BASI|nr:hypothetical protein [Austropuccinia psidii MF-1]